MPLSDVAIRKAKPGAKRHRIYDRDGLYLEVTPSGGKLWRQKYRFAGKDRARNSFEAIGRKWLTVKTHEWMASHSEKQTLRLKKHAFPWIGKRPISDLCVADLRPLIDRITKAGNHEQAHRVLAAISNVFRHAVQVIEMELRPSDCT